MIPDDARPLEGDLSVVFCDIMRTVTHEWGFIVVVTAAATGEQWPIALTRIRASMLFDLDPKAEIHPSTLALPIMHLEGADYSTARSAFSRWLSAYDGEAEWESDIRRDVFVVVDETALESLLSDDLDLAWVVSLDAGSPDKAGRPDYAGWMRCQIRALGQLFEDMDAMDEGMAALCPTRQHSGQIPVFDGSPQGKILEVKDVTEGTNVEYSKGTQRGVTGGTRRMT